MNRSQTHTRTWTRGHDIDFDEWAELVGDKRWSYKGLLPYFRRVETHYKPREECDNPEEHGFDGPIHLVGEQWWLYSQSHL